MRRMLQVVSFLVVSVAVLGSAQAAQATPTKQAAVAMPDEYSAKVAQQVLQRGGNAVDASIAAALTLAVTIPRPEIWAAAVL